MFEPRDYWAPRNCLLAPLGEHAMAAGLLSEAADAILAGDPGSARDLVHQADMPILFEHAALVMSGSEPSVQRRRPVPPPAEAAVRSPSRMPSAETTRMLFARDGWHCRFCDCRVVPPKARNEMRAALPGAIRWSEAEGYHGAFYALSASVDHIVPHSAGGTNQADNVVTACWSCQFGRGAWSLDEVGLSDPRSRSPLTDEWDGLVRLLNRPRAPVARAVREIRDVPPHVLRRSRLAGAEWFAALDTIRPAPFVRLTDFVDSCADLGVGWRLKDVLLVRMVVGSETLNVIGIERDGLCQIPWSIGGAKGAFREFAEMLAACIPDAIAYETPHMWCVSKPGKQRISFLELLDDLPALRQALEALHSKLSEAQ
jgi:5-methylcytosine-specific restriction endonuclease McrA